MKTIRPTDVIEQAQLAMSLGKRIYDEKLNWRLHDLAEAQNELALLSPDPEWREEALSNIGFHYNLENDLSVLAKIRQLLGSDADDDVRLTAASVLGVQSSWPDVTLYRAMIIDQNEIVRQVAFRSLLKLAGKNYNEVQEVMRRVESGEFTPSSDTLRLAVGDEYVDSIGDNLYD